MLKSLQTILALATIALIFGGILAACSSLRHGTFNGLDKATEWTEGVERDKDVSKLIQKHGG